MRWHYRLSWHFVWQPSKPTDLLSLKIDLSIWIRLEPNMIIYCWRERCRCSVSVKCLKPDVFEVWWPSRASQEWWMVWMVITWGPTCHQLTLNGENVELVRAGGEIPATVAPRGFEEQLCGWGISARFHQDQGIPFNHADQDLSDFSYFCRIEWIRTPNIVAGCYLIYPRNL